MRKFHYVLIVFVVFLPLLLMVVARRFNTTGSEDFILCFFWVACAIGSGIIISLTLKE